MDTVNSFKRKTRKRFVILYVALILLVALIVGIIAGLMVHSKNKGNSGEVSTGGVSTAAALKSICSVTLYPDLCLVSLQSSNTSDPEKIFGVSLSVVLASLEKMSSMPDEYANRTDDPRVIASKGTEDLTKKGELSGSS